LMPSSVIIVANTKNFSGSFVLKPTTK
jgi:hypothetical protein